MRLPAVEGDRHGSLRPGAKGSHGRGHTGRALVLPTGAVSIYVLITVAALLRVGSALGWLGRWALLGAGLAWAAAFFMFVALYWTVLTEPRVDGRPG